MRDLRIERELKNMEINFDFRTDVPLNLIEIDAGAVNNIRLGQALDDEVIARYLLALSTGSEFPGVVLYRKKDRYRVCDGMHRIHVFEKAKLTEIDAYVCDLNDKDHDRVIKLLQRSLNRHGKEYTEEERIEHARYLHDKLGYSIVDAAKQMLVKGTRLAQTLKVAKIVRTTRVLFKDEPKVLAAIFKPPTKGGLTETAFIELGRLQDDDLKKQTTRFALRAQLGADDTKEICRQLREARTAKAREAVFAEWAERRKKDIQGTAGGILRNPSSPLRSAELKLDQVRRFYDSEEKVNALTARELDQALRTAQETLKWARKNVHHIQRILRKKLSTAA